MKKLFLMAAAAATILASCVENSVAPTPEGGKTSISVSLSFDSSSATRALDTWSNNSSSRIISDVLDNGYIYVLDNNQIVYREEIANLTLEDGTTPNTTPNTTTQILGEGLGEDGEALLFPSTATVYVLANIPSNINNPANFMDMDELAAAVSTISYGSGTNTDYSKPAMGNVGGTVVRLTEIDNDAKTATAAVSINPLYTRVELKGVKGKNWVAGFDLVGVYLDNYYTGFTMTGKLVSEPLYDNGQDPSIGDKVASGWFGDNLTTPKEWLAPGAAIGPDDDVTTTTKVENAWAYNLAAGNIPRIIVQIDNLKVFPDDSEADGEQPDEDAASGDWDDNDNEFITVKKFKKVNGIELTALERGVIYQIEAIEFDSTNVGETPNIKDLEVTAVVEVIDWAIQPTEVVFD